MNQFEAAKLAHEKRQEKYKIYEDRREKRATLTIPEKKVPKLLQPTPKLVMKVTVSGIHDFEFEIHYGGVLMAGDMDRKILQDKFKKQLSAFGSVNAV